MKDTQLYLRYMDYKKNGASEDPDGTLGNNLVDEILRRAGGVDNFHRWLFRVECLQKLERVVN
jgi:hypothetical protein